MFHAISGISRNIKERPLQHHETAAATSRGCSRNMRRPTAPCRIDSFFLVEWEGILNGSAMASAQSSSSRCSPACSTPVAAPQGLYRRRKLVGESDQQTSGGTNDEEGNVDRMTMDEVCLESVSFAKAFLDVLRFLSMTTSGL